VSAEIVSLNDRRRPPEDGNGALAVVRDYLARVHPARVMARSIVDQAEIDAALPDADYFLAWLWEQGFKIEPIE
jgi:hypothetical protein